VFSPEDAKSLRSRTSSPSKYGKRWQPSAAFTNCFKKVIKTYEKDLKDKEEQKIFSKKSSVSNLISTVKTNSYIVNYKI